MGEHAALIMSKVVEDDAGCWVWQGHLGQGYGRVKLPGAPRLLAHVASYRTFVGEVPDGLQLDHLCRNRACVNPEHLEPVTAAENIRRGIAGDPAWRREMALTREERKREAAWQQVLAGILDHRARA